MNLDLHLIDVYDQSNRHDILYELLSERTPVVSISHTGMPTYQEHVEFVESRPYKKWYLAHSSTEDDYVGSIYLSKQNEIGIFIFTEHKGKGYGPLVVKVLMDESEGPFLANINPANKASIKMFENLGFKHIQNTYRLGDE